MTDALKQLSEWIEAVQEYNAGLRTIAGRVDAKLEEYRTITDVDAAGDAGVDLLFVRNRIEHMIKVWLGEGDGDD